MRCVLVLELGCRCCLNSFEEDGLGCKDGHAGNCSVFVVDGEYGCRRRLVLSKYLISSMPILSPEVNLVQHKTALFIMNFTAIHI
jgi:hypothetical protein